MTAVATGGQTQTATYGWLGPPACRDLVLGMTATIAMRAGAAHLDPLASSLERRLNLAIFALMLLVVAACGTYVKSGRRLPGAIVRADRVPAWLRPGGVVVLVLAGCAALLSALSLLALFDESQSLVDHASMAGTLIYLALGLRLQWAAAEGRTGAAFPPAPLSPARKAVVVTAAVAVVAALLATTVAAPGILARDREVAACRRNDVISLEAQEAISRLRGAELQQRIESLARQLNAC